MKFLGDFNVQLPKYDPSNKMCYGVTVKSLYTLKFDVSLLLTALAAWYQWIKKLFFIYQ